MMQYIRTHRKRSAFRGIQGQEEKVHRLLRYQEHSTVPETAGASRGVARLCPTLCDLRLHLNTRVVLQVKTIHGLDHPNILKFYNWCAQHFGMNCDVSREVRCLENTGTKEVLYLCRYETHNHLWLILEYCVGGDLKSLLQQDLCLPVESVHDLGRDLIAATQHLHSKGIIHCDLKPTNVLLDENGVIRLGGFGCARRLSDVCARSLFELPPVCFSTELVIN